MESLGDKLRKAREEKNFTLDQIARDTHITKRFLEALESESYSVLPGESYVVGFLRTYAEYLGINSDEAIQLYKNMLLQEQPAPMQELLHKKHSSLVFKIILAIIVFAGLGAGAWYLYNTSPETVPVGGEKRTKVDDGTVLFDGKLLERTFVDGTRFLVKLPKGGEREFQIFVKNEKALLLVGNSEYHLPVAEDLFLDLDEDKAVDFRLLLRSIDSRSNPARIVVRIDRKIEGEEPSLLKSTSENIEPEPIALSPILSKIPESGTFSGIGKNIEAITIIEALSRTPLEVKLRFKGAVWFRYTADLDKNEERFSNNNEEVSISANDVIRIWVSDGSRVNLLVGTRVIELGGPGELGAWQLSWVFANKTNTLQLQPLY